MNSQELFSIFPKPARLTAAVLLSIAVTVGVIAGAFEMHAPHGHVSPLGSAIGLGGGVLVGSLFGLFVLALGYVYGDARRRNMPAVPWTLIALFVPNLLGFLLYFVLRKPLGAPCPQCGQAITPEQRFCSWCGYSRTTPPSGGFTPSQISAPPSV
jgi:hypothetical protein